MARVLRTKYILQTTAEEHTALKYMHGLPHAGQIKFIEHQL